MVSKRERPKGICHICGANEKLSKEHVPPEQAFNSTNIIVADFHTAGSLLHDDIQGKIKQGGVWHYTLCENCNNNTGSWYGKEFAQWCYEGAYVISNSLPSPRIIYPFRFKPPRVLKQIVTMFFSINGVNFHKQHPYLVDFVLKKELTGLPPNYRFFVHYHRANRFRFSHGAFVINFLDKKVIHPHEIVFPPFGYRMTTDSSMPDKRLYEITYFAKFGFSERVELWPKIPELPINTILPGDYRTMDEILEK